MVNRGKRQGLCRKAPFDPQVEFLQLGATALQPVGAQTQPVERIAPQLDAGKGRQHARPAGRRHLHDRHIVRQHSVATTQEGGGQRRLTDPGSPRKGDRPSIDLHATGMQRHEATGMAQEAEHAPQQKYPHVGGGWVHVGLYGYVPTVFHVVGRHAGNRVTAIAIGTNLKQRPLEHRALQPVGHSAETNFDIRHAVVAVPFQQIRERQLGDDPKTA
ncbi:hypothetical protein VZ95_01390 [Elstera litoralis]|uniref:Uncharacterized protein n=1 Tax=Elstera litoralis TaxID=552518 RepID=A0A0F3IWP1_9PROT|nr:hypothetical protein VZ95_01390 [Elstera litoralis]